jgi:hypothetical protein
VVVGGGRIGCGLQGKICSICELAVSDEVYFGGCGQAIIVGFPASLAVGESELQRVAISEHTEIIYYINPSSTLSIYN